VAVAVAAATAQDQEAEAEARVYYPVARNLLPSLLVLTHLDQHQDRHGRPSLAAAVPKRAALPKYPVAVIPQIMVMALLVLVV